LKQENHNELIARVSAATGNFHGNNAFADSALCSPEKLDCKENSSFSQQKIIYEKNVASFRFIDLFGSSHSSNHK